MYPLPSSPHAISMPTWEPLQEPCQLWTPCNTRANFGAYARIMPTLEAGSFFRRGEGLGLRLLLIVPTQVQKRVKTTNNVLI